MDPHPCVSSLNAGDCNGSGEVTACGNICAATGTLVFPHSVRVELECRVRIEFGFRGSLFDVPSPLDGVGAVATLHFENRTGRGPGPLLV